MTVERAAALIRAGKLVAFPTETVYGLGANALDAAAVERIFAAKGRPRTSPLIVHVDSIDMARSLASAWPDAAEILAQRYWPGPLTMVLPKQSIIPDIVTAGLATVGLRMPDHPVALELIRRGGSAHRRAQRQPFHGIISHPPRPRAESMADYALDGGPARVGIESTVLSLAGPATLLRPGVIPLPEIEALIGPVATRQPIRHKARTRRPACTSGITGPPRHCILWKQAALRLRVAVRFCASATKCRPIRWLMPPRYTKRCTGWMRSRSIGLRSNSHPPRPNGPGCSIGCVAPLRDSCGYHPKLREAALGDGAEMAWVRAQSTQLPAR